MHMDNQEQPKTEGVSGSADSTQSSNATNQSLPDDLKKVADRAKAASQGFSFEKLFEGRLDRMNYMYGAIGGLVLGYIISMIPLIGLIIDIGLLVVTIGMSARRFRDTGTTGWAAAVCIIPYVGFLVVVYLCWKEGDKAANAFGAVPDPKREVFRAILNT